MCKVNYAVIVRGIMPEPVAVSLASPISRHASTATRCQMLDLRTRGGIIVLTRL